MGDTFDAPFPENSGVGDANAPDPIEEALARYVDDLTSGRPLDPTQVLVENPGIGHEVLERLEDFLSLRDEDRLSGSLGTLGDYTLRRQLGRGGMGVVYEAWENSMDRRVALKVLPPGIAADDRAFQRFLREARTAGKLTHPNVVPVYATGIKEQTPYYAMELVEGETLAQLVATMRSAAPDAPTTFGPSREHLGFYAAVAGVFADVADGLQHAHSKKVIHRDIKPSNLILERGGDGGETSPARLRVLDFGLARLEGQESLSVTGECVGTPLYMSPEQARRKKIPVDHRTDVYSLGATLYEVLTLEPPFRGKDHEDTLSQIIQRDPRPPRQLNPRVPRDLETIVLKCLRKDALDRYGTAEALGQDLRRFVRGDPIEARVEAWWGQTGRRLWRARGRVAALALVLVAVVAATLLLLEKRRQSQLQRGRQYVQLVESAVLKREMGRLAHKPNSVVPETLDPFTLLYHIEDFESSLELGQVDQALDTLGEATRLDDSRADAYYHRAVCWCLLDRLGDARSELAKCLRRNSGHVPAQALWDTIERRKSSGDEVAGTPTGGSREMQVRRRLFGAMLALDRKEEAKAYGEIGWASPSSVAQYVGGAMEWLLGSGTALLATGDHQGAALRFAVAVDRWPDALVPTLLLGQSLLLLEEETKAHDLFERYFEIASSGEDAASRQERTAIAVTAVYRSVGNLEKALEWAAHIASVEIRERTRADLLCHCRRFDDAADAGLLAVSGDSENPDNYVYLQWAARYCSENRLDVVNGFCTEAIQRNPRNGAAYSVRAMVPWRRGDKDAALRLFETAEHLDPSNVTTRIWHGSMLAEGGDLRGALAVYQEAFGCSTRTVNENRGLLSMTGRVQSLLGNHEEALELFTALVRLDPGVRWNHALIARELALLGRFSDALPWIETSRRRSPRDSWTRSELGRTLETMQRLPEAAVELGAAAELEPDNPSTAANLGCVLMRLGRLEEAATSLRAALAMAPKRVSARDDLKTTLVLLGREDEALEALVAGMKIDSETAWRYWVIVLLDRELGFGRTLPYEVQDAAKLARAWDSAVVELERIRDLGSGGSSVFFALGIAYLRGDVRRDLAKAREALETARTMGSPEDPNVLAALAEVLLLEGHNAEAVGTLEQALALREGDPFLESRHAAYSESLEPPYASFRSIDAVLRSRDPGTDAELAERYTAKAFGDAPDRFDQYLHSCVLERSGAFGDALVAFQRLDDTDQKTKAVRLHVADCLRQTGDAPEAEKLIREALGSNLGDDADAWSLWLRISFDHLGRTPSELLADFPVDTAKAEDGAASDIQVLLQSLARDGSIRINCGSDTVEQVEGQRWERDRFFNVGKTGRLSPAQRLGLSLSTPYGTERYFEQGVGLGRYRVPLPSGPYSVTLHFLEFWWTTEGLRRFTERLEGVDRLVGYEPILAAGFDQPDAKSFDVTVEDGVLDIEFVPEVGNPCIAGIEIRPAAR